MKNIHVLQTDKPSRLHTYKGVLNLAAGEFVAPTIVKNDLINLNIYITSDKEIKEGDWVITPTNDIIQWAKVFQPIGKKIILTTDAYLIKDDVQTIDDTFLEWFVKNPSCEFVKIVDDVECLPMPNIHIHKRIYKIIIPQEEPKQMSKPTALDLYEKEINSLIERYEEKEISKREFITMKHNLYYNAKEMEKEQIIDAASDHCYPTRELARIDAEEYYNETYKKDK
jgi:hypothetical protein